MREVAATWWPLALSWLFMGLELPMLSAVVLRLPNPELHLAAYGGIVFPIALIVEAPIIMLLSASTALVVDRPHYLQLRAYANRAGAVLTVLHLVIATTSLYDFIARDLIDAPAAIVEPGRIGVLLMLPWTWSIAYRRFHQGVMIRYGASRRVGLGTVVRLLANACVLTWGYTAGDVQGIVIAAAAVSAGVLAEAVYVGFAVQSVLRERLPNARMAEPPDLRRFLRFYVPLALTSLIHLLVEPIGSAAVSRMPLAIESLAVWPVIHGFIFLLQAPGIALNEVVVARAGSPEANRALRRLAAMLIVVTTVLLAGLAAPPLAAFWFGDVAALAPQLCQLAGEAVWYALPMPALCVLQSWHQGSLMALGQTRGITESVALGLLATGAVLVAGVVLATTPGIVVATVAFGAGALVQTIWLRIRHHGATRSLRSASTP